MKLMKRVDKMELWIRELLTKKLTPSIILYISGIFVGVSTNMIAYLVLFRGTFEALIFYTLASLFYLVGSLFWGLLAWKLIVATTWQTRLPKLIVSYFAAGLLCLGLGFLFALLAARLLIQIV